jgi:NAD(P)-dependent dehydrogenase (short-subunit alcohol dehydrogenase family)
MGKVVLVTGASSGIGKATAELLMNNGCRVYGTSRRPQDQEPVKKAEVGGGFLRMLQMDVCNEESIGSALDILLKNEGRLDILINNAGNGIAGSVEDLTPDEAYYQFNTNFFGMHRVCRQVIPVMRKQKSGLIINISSVAAQFAIPFQSMYSASKAAIEAVSEAMRIEVAPFGIKVAAVEPGDVRTGFTDSRKFAEASGDGSAYTERFKKSVGVMIHDETHGPEPIVIAKEILRLAGMKNPPVRTTVGFQYKLFIFLKRFLPLRFAVYIVSKMY